MAGMRRNLYQLASGYWTSIALCGQSIMQAPQNQHSM
jgi:hypothetical protein